MKNPLKIHFACLFGVEYEIDLMPFWTKHWLDKKFDSYKVYLHKEDGKIGREIQQEFRDLGFSVECLDGPHSNGNLRRVALGYYAGTLPPRDFLVLADADEFCKIDFRPALQEYDLITGFMVDRYTSRLEGCYCDPFEQYPEEEPFTKEILKNFTPPYLRQSEWPYTRRTKILAARAGDDSTYAGSHCMKSLDARAKILEDQKVYHFAWRESAKRKLAVKSYYDADNLSEIYGGELPADDLYIATQVRDMECLDLSPAGVV